ncbi:MAG: PKD domain-containing protein [Bacteroidetes bacterium]|nr:PKD domain-containing protein [Bacteroidota bacterium]
MNKVFATLSFLFVFTAFSRTAQAQIVNKYAAVINFDINCNNRITVDDASEFHVGDTILIIQMKTFSVDSTNTPTFGDTLAYNGAGNYEYNVVKKILLGNKIEFKYQVKRTYDWTLGRVQIVRVAYANNYIVNSPITCMPWNGFKGGVVVIRGGTSIVLNANIDVTGRGFRAGQPLLLQNAVSCNKSDYYYPANGDGGQKGEGIGYLSNNRNYGRGKLTNGGGGGTNSRSGGAGGGNGGTGGGGGDQYQAASAWCPTNVMSNLGGIGGLALGNNTFLSKIFLGGGGGCGQGDNLSEKAGGNGGGIVILDAPTIIGNNNSLIADGDSAAMCTAAGPGCEDDGGGGGGAGGSILINATNVTNLLKVFSRGGKGSKIYSSITVNATFMPGPGGGGGGGAVWFKSATVPAGVTVNTAGGVKGVLPQFINSSNGSKDGSVGITVNNLNLNFPTDTFLIKYNLDFLDSITKCATIKFVNKTKVAVGVGIFSWWWSFGDGVTDTAKNPTHNYGAGGTYTVKVAAQDITGCTDTLTRIITLNSLNYGVRDTVVGCRTHTFIPFKKTGPTAAKYQWNFGDGDTATGNPITHTYTAKGSKKYTVVLTVTDSTGCQDTVHFTADVVGVIARYNVSKDSVCQKQQVNFTDKSDTTAIFWAWTYGDGNVDSIKNPNHIYPYEGTYKTSLIVGNIFGCLDTAYKNIVVDSISPVDYTPSDTILCQGQTIILKGFYLHQNARSADWDLGDGFKIKNTDPVIHAYDAAGAYNVTLTVHFRSCPDSTFSKLININPYPQLNLGPDTTMCANGASLVLADNINVSNPYAKWKWNTGDTTSFIAVRHPGIYTARINIKGCTTSDSVEVFKDCYLDIPNAFAPNGTGANAYFLPRQLLSKSISQFKMTIFDRWGQEVFQTNSMNGRGWDGKFNGKDQPMGVYVYQISVTFANGVSESYTGNVTLIR